MTINLSAALAPSFYQLHNDIKRRSHADYWLKGGRGSTKSSFVSIEIVLGIMKDSDANAVVLRKVYGTIRESAYDQYLWAIDTLGVSKFWKTSTSPMQLTYIPTGQQIRFKGADKPEKIKSQKFRHGYTKFKHFEEVTEFRGMHEIRSINQSLDRGGPGGVVTFYSYNPPESQNNWVNQAVEHAKLRDDTMVSSTTYLTVDPNWLGPKFIADALQLEKDNEKAYRHEYLGEVTGTGAEVFTNLELREMDDEEVGSFDGLRRGLDYGFAHDPLAYIQGSYDAKHRVLYIYGEIYQIGMTNRRAVAAIQKRNPMNDPIISDREPRTVAEFNDYGLHIIAAKKGPGSRDHNYKWLQDLRKIVIDPVRCPNAAREFSGYELARDANGNFKSGYPDGNDHTIDATAYAMNNDINRIRVQTFNNIF